MSKKKGDRRERQARDILEEAGFVVENPNYSRYGNVDFFNLFDIMALKKDRKVQFVQVKSSSARGINEFSEKCSEIIPFDHINVEYWVCYDRKGWRIIDIKEDGSYEDVFDERDKDCSMGELVKEFKM